MGGGGKPGLEKRPPGQNMAILSPIKSNTDEIRPETAPLQLNQVKFRFFGPNFRFLGDFFAKKKKAEKKGPLGTNSGAVRDEFGGLRTNSGASPDEFGGPPRARAAPHSVALAPRGQTPPRSSDGYLGGQAGPGTASLCGLYKVHVDPRRGPRGGRRAKGPRENQSKRRKSAG